MKKHDRFLSVFEYTFSSNPIPVDLKSVKVLVSRALSKLPDSIGVKRQSFRRDVVIAHGYTGDGAQEALAQDFLDFWKGENENLLTKLPADYQAKATEFRNSKKEPVRVRSFREWFDSQNQSKILDSMAKSLKRRYPMEDYDECLSMVGFCVAYWLKEGNLDSKIEEKGDMSVTLLNEWIRRRHLNEVHSRGTEPLFRMKGARTNAEKTSIWRDGNKVGMAEEATKSDGWSVALAEGDDEDKFEFEVICRNLTPDQLVEEAITYENLKNSNTAAVKTYYSGASERYVSVLRILENGGDRVTISEEQGISLARGGHLACRVRNVIKNSTSNALKVFEAIKEEPWTTREELIEDLQMEKRDFNAAISYLVSSGGIVDKNGSFCALGAS